jgi:hypothetical protein
VDPISIGIELELGAMLIAAVGAFATWLHHRHHKDHRRQRDRHQQELRAQTERHHRERLQAMARPPRPAEELDIIVETPIPPGSPVVVAREI